MRPVYAQGTVSANQDSSQLLTIGGANEEVSSLEIQGRHVRCHALSYDASATISSRAGTNSVDPRGFIDPDYVADVIVRAIPSRNR